MGWGEAFCSEKDTGGSSSEEYSLARALQKVTIFSPIPGPPKSLKAEMIQTKQPTWWENSPLLKREAD